MTAHELEATTIEDGSTDRTIDPAALADREGIEVEDRTYTHEDRDHCEADADGRVVVGIARDDGDLLLLLDPTDEHAILPNCVVDPDEDWTTVARETVEGTTGVPVTIEGVEAVRRIEHVCEGENPHNETFHVVFRGSVADEGAAADPTVDDDTDWTAGWYDHLPIAVGDDPGDAVADIRRFLPEDA